MQKYVDGHIEKTNKKQKTAQRLARQHTKQQLDSKHNVKQLEYEKPVLRIIKNTCTAQAKQVASKTQQHG